MQPDRRRTVTPSQVRSPLDTSCRANWNNRAALAGLFEKDTLQQPQQGLRRVRTSRTSSTAPSSTQSKLTPRPTRNKGKHAEHLQGDCRLPSSGTLASRIIQRDHKPGEARRLRAGNNCRSPGRTECGRYAVSKYNQSKYPQAV